MAVKEELHRLVDELPDERCEQARQLLQSLVHSEAGVYEEHLDPHTLASLERGLEDIRKGRVKTVEQYIQSAQEGHSSQRQRPQSGGGPPAVKLL